MSVLLVNLSIIFLDPSDTPSDRPYPHPLTSLYLSTSLNDSTLPPSSPPPPERFLSLPLLRVRAEREPRSPQTLRVTVDTPRQTTPWAPTLLVRHLLSSPFDVRTVLAVCVPGGPHTCPRSQASFTSRLAPVSECEVPSSTVFPVFSPTVLLKTLRLY